MMMCFCVVFFYKCIECKLNVKCNFLNFKKKEEDKSQVFKFSSFLVNMIDLVEMKMKYL